MSRESLSSEQKRKPKKRVEYRWFPATPSTGILGGIVATTRANAEAWARGDLGAGDTSRTLVRVRMEYEL